HMPHEYDSKVLEFEYAKYGMTGIETAYAVLKTAMPDVPDSKWVELLSTNPRTIFGLEKTPVQKGAKASLTLFEPDATTVVEEKLFLSKSKNSAFIGRSLRGKVRGVINGTKTSIN